jgi:hypothetical protein
VRRPQNLKKKSLSLKLIFVTLKQRGIVFQKISGLLTISELYTNSMSHLQILDSVLFIKIETASGS